MLTVKKRLAAFGLLLLVALPLFFTVNLLVKQKVIQSHREQRFDTELLQTVVIDAQKISWIEEEKELLIDGKLFDVKSFERTGANIVLRGFFDHKEEKTVKQIKETEYQKNKPGSPFNKSIAKFLFPPTYLNQQEIVNYEGFWEIIVKQYHSFTELMPSGTVCSLTHPPC